MSMCNAIIQVRVLGRADHVNIIKLHESFISDSTLYIITDLAEGGDLASRIKRRAQPYCEDDIWNYLIQTAQVQRNNNFIVAMLTC